MYEKGEIIFSDTVSGWPMSLPGFMTNRYAVLKAPRIND
jgi:hypothetical protein